MTRKRFNDLCNSESRNEALNQLSERILHNVIVTQYIINHCSATNIRHYRLSSSLFPLLTDQTLEISLEDLPNYATIKQELRQAGLIARTLRISIGSHPDQFNVLASNNKDAVKRTINELNFQASVLDQLGLPQDHSAPMNIHINYTPQADETLEIVATRFFRNLSMCDKGVYKRITIENEDKGFFNVDNCIKFSDYLLIHSELKYLSAMTIYMIFAIHQRTQYYISSREMCLHMGNTDKPHNDECEAVADYFAPVFHWSEGKPEKPRAHADYFALGNAPPHIAIDVDRPVKWECEVKGKDKAIRLLQKALGQIM